MDVPTQALRTGWITFGLVSLPVQLFPATRRHGVDLHQVHATDGSRIRHRRVCQAERREVHSREIAKGYETPDGHTVVLEEELSVTHLPYPHAQRSPVGVYGLSAASRSAIMRVRLP
ncbi:Ku protein [Streptomyces sp. NPDC087437]|uniref:Ku protein n=1 Tax=Streptomyces sp. NPDC087437 TaxID=3365789 RepID=UPI003812AD03